MTELGDAADALHEQVGAAAAVAGLAGLIVVGDGAAAMLTGAKSVPGWQGEQVSVPDAAAAISALRDRLRDGDVVLVKASHSIHLERVALALTGELPVSDQAHSEVAPGDPAPRTAEAGPGS
jgi:UDP-N-acetylmuramoyl-tripeptide--D-alanyl-D-alanine ligase